MDVDIPDVEIHVVMYCWYVVFQQPDVDNVEVYTFDVLLDVYTSLHLVVEIQQYMLTSTTRCTCLVIYMYIVINNTSPTLSSTTTRCGKT